MEKPARNWASKREKKAQTMKKIEHLLDGKYVPTEAIIEVLEQLIRPETKWSLKATIKNKQASYQKA